MPFSGNKVSGGEPGRKDNSSPVYVCSLCGNKIEPKPGFRLSFIKCKCGGSPVAKA
jgi:hypothetical protein